MSYKSYKAVVLYDFTGDSQNYEIVLTAGEIVTVTGDEIGEGWLEGINSLGEKGYFPLQYVKPMTEEYKTSTIATDRDSDKSENDVLETQWEENASWIPDVEIQFDSGMLSEIRPARLRNHLAEEVKKANIVEINGMYCWAPISDPYTVTIYSTSTKFTKYAGMKSFICYKVTPSFNNITVHRRYKHFNWLYDRLVTKYAIIAIPPIPEKQISGRYDSQFIEHRRQQLQEFANWICRHPVLSKCSIWMHFITCIDVAKWKTGKRAAEKECAVETPICSWVSLPKTQLENSNCENQINTFSSFVTVFENVVGNLITVANIQTRRFQMQIRRELIGFSEKLTELASALEVDERRVVASNHLSVGIRAASKAFLEISLLYSHQPKNDWIPFSDRLIVHRDLARNFFSILALQKNAIQKLREGERLMAENKIEKDQLEKIHENAMTIRYAAMAEISHYFTKRDTHLHNAMRELINAQIEFYQKIISTLANIKSQYEF